MKRIIAVAVVAAVTGLALAATELGAQGYTPPGISRVAHDGSLAGSGTSTNPLRVDLDTCGVGSAVRGYGADGAAICVAVGGGTTEQADGTTILGTGSAGSAFRVAVPVPSCVSTQIPKWTGSAYACASDVDTNTTYTAAAPIGLTGTAFGLVACSTAGHVYKWTGTAWACAADNDTVLSGLSVGYIPYAGSPSTLGNSNLTYGVAGSAVSLAASQTATALTPWGVYRTDAATIGDLTYLSIGQGLAQASIWTETINTGDASGNLYIGTRWFNGNNYTNPDLKIAGGNFTIGAGSGQSAYFPGFVGVGVAPASTASLFAHANGRTYAGYFDGLVNVNGAFNAATTITENSLRVFTVAGTGLTSSANTVNVGAGVGIVANANDVAIDPTYTQRRVSGTCTAGSSIRVIAQDGTVTCETDDDSVFTPSGTSGRSTRFPTATTLGVGAWVDDGTNVTLAGTAGFSGNVAIGDAFAVDTLTVAARTTLSGGVTPTSSQLRAVPGTTGALSLLSYAADNNTIGLDVDYAAGIWTSRATSTVSIQKTASALAIFGTTGVTTNTNINTAITAAAAAPEFRIDFATDTTALVNATVSGTTQLTGHASLASTGKLRWTAGAASAAAELCVSRSGAAALTFDDCGAGGKPDFNITGELFVTEDSTLAGSVTAGEITTGSAYVTGLSFLDGDVTIGTSGANSHQITGDVALTGTLDVTATASFADVVNLGDGSSDLVNVKGQLWHKHARVDDSPEATLTSCGTSTSDSSINGGVNAGIVTPGADATTCTVNLNSHPGGAQTVSCRVSPVGTPNGTHYIHSLGTSSFTVRTTGTGLTPFSYGCDFPNGQ